MARHNLMLIFFVTTRGCQNKYPISWATVIANKTTIFDVILPEQLGILT